MDKREAQLILSAVRPGAPEADEPTVAQALAVMESDPELKVWWEAQQAFDLKVAAKLVQAPVPADLRERLVASPKVIAIPPQWRHRGLLAAAAAVAILCVTGVFWQVATAGQLDRADFANAAVSNLDDTSGAPLLAMTSSDHEMVKAWLKTQSAPMGDLPSKLGSVPSVGCQKYVIHGHTVSLICFELPSGGVVHLFTVEKSALSDPPSSQGPHFDKLKNWNVASWSDSKMSYMLVTTVSMDDLKQLL